MTSELNQSYHSLAKILEYPDANFAANSKQCWTLLQNAYPEAAEVLLPLLNYVQEHSLSEIEELYIQTFVVSASCSLDVGYLIFGEDYKRGQFMAEIKALHKKYNIDCGVELPDHLPNMLKLMTRIDFADAVEIANHFVAPALEHMLKSFGESQNVYALPIQAVDLLVRRDFMVSPRSDSNFPVKTSATHEREMVEPRTCVPNGSLR